MKTLQTVWDMRIHTLAALMLGILCAGTCYAQFNSNVQGSILDQSGAAVPRATVRLLNLSTHVTQVTASDTAGDYHFISVAPGSYQVTVTASG
ncbi:MAG: carboxypeptidase-like regulatory domain-containing protein, partial [Terriglobia bacterium]